MLDINKRRNNYLRVTANKEGLTDDFVSRIFRKAQEKPVLDDPYDRKQYEALKQFYM